MHKLNKTDKLLLIVFFLLPLIVFKEAVFLGKALYLGDISRIHYPLRAFMREAIGQGQLPLWNPYITCGYPHLAGGQVGTLYPLNLLFLLPIPLSVAMTWFIVIHIFGAEIFMYVLVRWLTDSRFGALISALTFAFSGFVLGQVTNLPIMVSGIWLPLIFLWFTRAIERRSFFHASLAGLALGFQILAESPQIVFYSLLLLGGYCIFSLFDLLWGKGSAKDSITLFGLLVVITVIGIGLAGAWIMPMAQLKAESVRDVALPYKVLTSYSLRPWHLTTFVVPGFWGNSYDSWWGDPNFFELQGYVGLLPLMLVLLAWRKRENRMVFFFLASTAVSLALALGKYTPVYLLLQHVPGFNFFRAPARWMSITTFSLSILAGFGFTALVPEHHWNKGKELCFGAMLFLGSVVAAIALAAFVPRGRVPDVRHGRELANLFFVNLFLLFSLAYLIGIGLLIIFLWSRARRVLAASLAGLGIVFVSLTPFLYQDKLSVVASSDRMSDLFQIYLCDLLFSVVVICAALLVFVLYMRGTLASPGLGIACAVLIFTDLSVAARDFNLVRDPSYFLQEYDSTVFLQSDTSLCRVYPENDVESLGLVEALWNDVPAMYRMFGIRGGSHLTTRRFSAYMDLVKGADSPVTRARLLGLMNVKYILARDEKTHDAYAKVYSSDRLNIYENKAVLPRVLTVPGAEVMASDQGVLDRLASDDFDPSCAVLLEEALPEGAKDLGGCSEPWTAQAEVISYLPNKVIVEADLGRAGWLLLLDAYYPGWVVYVDGKEDKLYRADYLFRAIFLNPGTHTVIFQYEPASFRVGLLISLSTIALLIVIVAFKLRSKPSVKGS